MPKNNTKLTEEAAFIASLGTKKEKQPVARVSDPDDGKWEKPSALSWFRMLKGHRLDYRPHTQTWQYRGKTKSGDVLKFIKQHS